MRTRLRRWPAWAADAAAAWCLLYAALGAAWAAGAPGFPFGVGDDEGADMGSLLVGATPGATGAVIAAVGLALLPVALALRPGAALMPGRLARGVGWTVAVVLLLLVPDVRLMRDFAYLLAGGVGFVHKADWPTANQVWCVVGGLLWVAAAVASGRRDVGACVRCGLQDGAGPEEAVWARRGRILTLAAVALPVPYELIRWAWAAGWPIGVTTGADGIRAWTTTERLGMVVVGALPMLGGVLTHGLEQRWGEVFPRWIPRVGGRAVPVGAAVGAAVAATLLIVTGALSLLRITLNEELGRVPEATPDVTGWGAWAPGLLWVPWGLALAGATYAYWRRRRGSCADCGPRRVPAVALSGA